MAATAMDDLADRYADRGVTSVFLYTNEAHPGENYPHHTSMDVKRANARAFVEHSKLRRSVVLDDLEGGAHHAYGLLPNMTWIISRCSGFVDPRRPGHHTAFGRQTGARILVGERQVVLASQAHSNPAFEGNVFLRGQRRH